MEKRYQVFVSSTYEDLKEERQEVIQAVLALDCFPAGMELFPAADEDQWTLIKKVIDESDYYIVIIAGRYGSLASSGIGYTEKEYEYAVSQGKPVVGFIRDPGSIPSSRTDQSNDARHQLTKFRGLVEERICRYWSTKAELREAITISLVNLIRSRPAIGWVRGNLVPDEARLQEMSTFGHEGMEKAHHHLDDQDLQKFLLNSKKIRVLKTWFPESRQIAEGLEGAIKNNATVSLLLCKPGSDILKQRSRGAHKDEWWGSFMVYHAVEDVKNFLRAREATDLDRPAADVQIACYESWPGCPVIWYGQKDYDENILMGFYIRGRSSPSWPWVNVTKGSYLAKILHEQFDELWNLRDTERLNTLEEMSNWLEREENMKWARRGVIPQRSTES
jgi:Domain of unknown function (DUF4062)